MYVTRCEEEWTFDLKRLLLLSTRDTILISEKLFLRPLSSVPKVKVAVLGTILFSRVKDQLLVNFFFLYKNTNNGGVQNKLRSHFKLSSKNSSRRFGSNYFSRKTNPRGSWILYLEISVEYYILKSGKKERYRCWGARYNELKI